MLLYDVTYYDAPGKRLADYDTNVCREYLDVVRKNLKRGETAFARCANNPHESRVIDRAGIRPAPRQTQPDWRGPPDMPARQG